MSSSEPPRPAAETDEVDGADGVRSAASTGSGAAQGGGSPAEGSCVEADGGGSGRPRSKRHRRGIGNGSTSASYEHTAHPEVEQLARRLEKLRRTGERLSEARTAPEVAAIAVDHGLGVLGADHGAIALATADGAHLEVIHHRGYDEEALQTHLSTPLDVSAPHTEAFVTGEPVILRHPGEYVSRYGDTFHVEDARGTQSVVALPLRDRNRSIGVLLAGFSSAGGVSAAGEALARLLGDQISRALADALLLDDERHSRRVAEAFAWEREQVLAAVAHDLRSPLSVIATTLELLTMHSFPPPQRTKLLARVGRAVNQMNRLIGDLLEVTRIEARGLPLDLVEVDMNELLRDTVEALLPRAEAYSVKVVPVVQESLPPVRADPQRVSQLLDNLLSNALRHGGEGGVVELLAQQGRDELIVKVADQGPGIPDWQQGRLFERYWSGKKNNAHDTGLGLAIAKSIVEAHGGRIWVEGRLGEGATFCFTLPPDGPAAGTARPGSSAAQPDQHDDDGAASPAARDHSGEPYFRDLLDKLPAATYTCDADGLITYCNRHAIELWGRAPRLGDPTDRFCGAFKLYTPDGEPQPRDECWMALALRHDREFDNDQIVIERPDGERRTVLAYANPAHGPDGELTGAVGVLVDITELLTA